MIDINTNNITNYKPSEFAEFLNLSVKTLQCWDRDKVLIAKRTPTDRRYYTYDQYLEYKGIDSENNNLRKIILYTRVSTKNQILFLQNFVNSKGIIIDEVVEDRGSGLNYKDRFIRFVNNELLSPQEELVQDIVSILHVFSCRIYGMRKYKKK